MAELPAKHAKKREMKIQSQDLISKDEVYAIVGACCAAHRDKGCGFLEAVYQESFRVFSRVSRALIHFAGVDPFRGP